MEHKIRGKVWKFGDNISTDLLMPGFAAMSRPDMSLEEAARFCMYANRPGWAGQVRSGDILIGGKNFGCGSSRPGSRILKALGIGIVIAESISRIFFRNSINLGLPVMVCPGIQQFVREGEEIEADLTSGLIRNLSTGEVLQGEPLPQGSPPLKILEAGGITPMLKQQLTAGQETAPVSDNLDT